MYVRVVLFQLISTIVIMEITLFSRENKYTNIWSNKELSDKLHANYVTLWNEDSGDLQDVFDRLNDGVGMRFTTSKRKILRQYSTGLKPNLVLAKELG